MAKEATSKEKYEAAAAQYAAAQEALAEAEAQREQFVVQEARQRVASPVDGNVLLIYQRVGSYVQGGTPLALVGNFDRLLFSVTLEDKHTRHLSVGATLTVTFPEQAMRKAYDTEYAAGNQGSAENIVATVKEITPPLTEPAGMRRVLYEIDNRARVLEPLTYNNVSVRAGRPYDCLAVPMTAMTDAAKNEVFAVDGEGIIHRRDVETGADDGEYIEIISGLSEGDIVVVQGFEGLADGAKANVSIEGGER